MTHEQFKKAEMLISEIEYLKEFNNTIVKDNCVIPAFCITIDYVDKSISLPNSLYNEVLNYIAERSQAALNKKEIEFSNLKF